MNIIRSSLDFRWTHKGFETESSGKPLIFSNQSIIQWFSKAAEPLLRERLGELPRIFQLWPSAFFPSWTGCKWLRFWCMRATDIGDAHGYGLLEKCFCSAQTQTSLQEFFGILLRSWLHRQFAIWNTMAGIDNIDRTHPCACQKRAAQLHFDGSMAC